MKHEDLLNDTYCFFSMNPHMRGVNKYDTCAYRGENGTKCAIGRFIPDEIYTPAMDALDETMDPLSLRQIVELVPFLQQFTADFLCELQAFHDNNAIWHEDSIKLRINRYHNLLERAKQLDSIIIE